jgi:hypothetical protein
VWVVSSTHNSQSSLSSAEYLQNDFPATVESLATATRANFSFWDILSKIGERLGASDIEGSLGRADFRITIQTAHAQSK